MPCFLFLLYFCGSIKRHIQAGHQGETFQSACWGFWADTAYSVLVLFIYLDFKALIGRELSSLYILIIYIYFKHKSLVTIALNGFEPLR